MIRIFVFENARITVTPDYKSKVKFNEFQYRNFSRCYYFTTLKIDNLIIAYLAS